MSSNWTLRFPRTSREAYGHFVSFEARNPDRIVGYVMALAMAFVAGLMVGGVL
jgi:hypothetical protein